MTPDEALVILEKRLGSYRGPTRGFHNFCCPFCSDHKYRFGINFTSGRVFCWKCEKRGSIKETLGINFYGGTPSRPKRIRVAPVVTPPSALMWRPLPPPGKKITTLAEDVFTYLGKRGIDPTTAWALDMGYGVVGKWQGTVIHPYYHDNGALAGWQARYISPNAVFKSRTADAIDLPGRLSPSDGGLYLLDRTREGEPIVITEGPYDALSVATAMPAVATFGSVLHPAQVRRMEKRNPSEYIVGYDPDKSPYKAVKVLRKNTHRPVKVVDWPRYMYGKDWGDLTPGAVKQILTTCVSPWKIGDFRRKSGS